MALFLAKTPMPYDPRAVDLIRYEMMKYFMNRNTQKYMLYKLYAFFFF